MRVWVVAGLVVVATVAKADFTSITVFGDSLSDMGNISAGTFGIQPGSDYYQGRFSNGPVWVERLATHKSISLTRSGAGGSNWAFGGAETKSGTFGVLFFQFPHVTTQLTRYLNTNPTINSSRLFVIWAGGNDYLGGATDPNIAVNNIGNMVTTLYNRGARQFLIPNLPLLGNVPRNVGTPNQGPANAVSAAHNAALATKIGTLRTTLSGVSVLEMDVASRLAAIQATPAPFGFTNVTGQALNNGAPVPNPDQYLFWDDVHPTRIGHQLLGELAIQVTTPPSVVSGTVALGDWLPAVQGQVAEFKIWNGSTVVQTIPNVALGSGGSFSFTTPLTENHTLTADVSHWVRKRLSVNLSPTTAAATFSLTNGDADLSGEIDAADIDLVISAFASADPSTDLDGSGEVDAADIDIAIANFGASDD